MQLTQPAQTVLGKVGEKEKGGGREIGKERKEGGSMWGLQGN